MRALESVERPAPWVRPDPLPLPLVTARVVLDVHRDEDASALCEAIRVSRDSLRPWLPWAENAPRDEAETLDGIRKRAKQRGFAHPDDYPLGIFDRSSPRRVLGGTGFVRIDADLRQAEVGYWLRPDCRGAGLCVEAVGHLISSGFADWGFRRVVIECDGDNAPSVQVAERLGLRRETHEVSSRWLEDRGWGDRVGFAVLAGEWDGERHRGPGP